MYMFRPSKVKIHPSIYHLSYNVISVTIHPQGPLVLTL